MEEFQIIMEVFNNGKHSSFKFQVELFYDSAQVQRFRLTGGDKVMELEKRLLVKRQPWKILNVNFAMAEVNEKTVVTLNRVFDRIDEKMTGKSKFKMQTLKDRVDYKYRND